MYGQMIVLDEALNGSEERDQRLKEKFMEEAYAPENHEPGWFSRHGGRLLTAIGTGLVVLGEKMKRTRPDFRIERADSHAQDTI